jgi:transposase
MKHHVGIDTHQVKSTFQHLDDEGTLGLTREIGTQVSDFERILAEIQEPVSITLEAGRNYWWLHQYFQQHPKVFQVNIVDPLRSRRLGRELAIMRGYGRAKTDRIDGEMLALQTQLALAPLIHVPTAEQLEARTLCRQRTTLSRQGTRAKNIIHALLAFHGKAVSIKTLQEDHTAKAELLAPLPAYVPLIVNQYLDWITLAEQQIGRMEDELDRVLPESHPQIRLLMSVPGIGLVLARIIYTEILDIKYFKEQPKYLISYAGLAPVVNESAGLHGPIKLNRHSNRYLKYAFIQAAHNAFDYPHYRRKYELDVKQHNRIVAKLNLARRLVKTVYWILTRQRPYSA